MSDYTEQCLKKFIEAKESFYVKIRYERWPSEIQVHFYYHDENYFNVKQTIIDLDNYLRQCNVHKLCWNTLAKIGINNSMGANYSELCFKKNFKYLTRLDIGKR